MLLFMFDCTMIQVGNRTKGEERKQYNCCKSSPRHENDTQILLMFNLKQQNHYPSFGCVLDWREQHYNTIVNIEIF